MRRTFMNARWAMIVLLHPRSACHAFLSTPLSARRSPSSRVCLNAVQIFYDSTNCLHRDIKYHPECPDRIDHCLDALRGHFYVKDNDNPGIAHIMVDVAANSAVPSNNQEYSSPFTKQELEHTETMLRKVHDPSYVASLQNKCETSRQRRIDEGNDELGWIGYIDGSDTYVTTESYDVGVRATGAWIRAVDAALVGSHHAAVQKDSVEKSVKSSNNAVALTRPPGHHATHSVSNGFCIFNFAMAAAAHALSINPSMKISILDWDVHFGQGLMDILDKCSSSEGAENDWTKNVRYVSLHQVPCFPYEGQSRKVQGRYDNVMTIPIQPESTWSCGYRELFTKYALPFVCSRDEWEPDLIIVCAGYDALDSDELASVNLVAKDYGEMTRLLNEQIGNSSSEQPALVFGLEGGYQLRDGVAGGDLSDALIETLKAMQ